jgi:hypothetical protein
MASPPIFRTRCKMQAAGTLDGLPNEILYEVLMDADQLDWRSSPVARSRKKTDGVRHPKPVAAAMRQTSRHWRNLVDDWSRCWFIEMSFGGHDQKQLDLLPSYLAASRGCDLDLWINWSEFLEENLFSLLLPHASQIRNLYHNFSNAKSFPNVVKLFAELAPFRLFRLSIVLFPTSMEPLRIATKYPKAFIPVVRIDGIPKTSQPINCNLHQADHLDIGLQNAYQRADITSFLRSLKQPRKLRVVLPWSFGGSSEVSTPLQSERHLVPHLRALHIYGTWYGVASVLHDLDSSRITKLCLNLRGPWAMPANEPTPANWDTFSNFENLSDVFLYVSSHQTWLWKALAALPWVTMERLALDMSALPWAEEVVVPDNFPRVVAKCLTQLKCSASTLNRCLALFQTCQFPVLDEFVIQLNTQRRTVDALTDFESIRSSCSQLRRIVLLSRPKFHLPDFMSSIGLLDISSLQYLDLSKVECDGEEALWKEAWSGATANLVNLEALSIQVPARHTRLRYCFEYCARLRTLSLAFAHNTSFNVLRLLGKTGRNCLPKLQILQLELPQDAGEWYARDLLDIAPRLQEVVSYRKSRETPLKEIGILFPEQSVDLAVFSGVALDVKLVWGDLCDTAFPYVPPINFNVWESW